MAKQYDYEKLLEESKELYNETLNPFTSDKAEKELLKLERNLRQSTNMRLNYLKQQGIGFSMGWYDKLLEKIEQTSGDGSTQLSKPTSIYEAYENIQLELSFLRLKVSTTQGVREVIERIRQEAYPEYKEKFTEEEFFEFWKWRQLNPIQEFFKIYPPSPPELRGSVGTMVIDLYNEGEVTRNMVEELITRWNRYKSNQATYIKKSLTTSELIGELDKLYAEIGYRRKY